MSMTSCLWLLLTFAVEAPTSQDSTTPLGDLDLRWLRQGWGEAQVDRSVEGNPLRIGGRSFARGVGSHAASVLFVELGGGCERFTAWVGVDDETEGRGSISFKVYGDGRLLYESGVVRGGEAARRVDVDLSGVAMAILATGAGGDDIHYDHADWAEAAFHGGDRRPHAVGAPEEERVVLTPPPAPQPKIHGPRVTGARPGRPFVFRIPCTGERPVRFSARGLPESLHLHPTTGILTGTAPPRVGEYVITFEAVNARGRSTRVLKLVVGEQLALTPPMGWNSWYIHYDRVSAADLRAAAEAMVASGMADFGYQYVNIDDCWMKKKGDEPYRDEEGAVLSNERFPDMKALADFIHARGLRAGLYTSPGPWTCAGYVGSYGHEAEDAQRFADWGFDFLKYDWCSYGQVASGEGRERLQAPYRQMAGILGALDRDLVLNLCQYGMGDVWEWGGDVGGHCWRTTGDLGLEGGGLLPGFYAIALQNARHHAWARPGRWNDPDYLLLGWVGDARHMGEGQPTGLTASEQYSYMSLWSLMAAPLIFSGDMTRLDDFTLGVLCNAEVIEIDQDPLGRQAEIVRHNSEELILARPLEDGSHAVGLFNLGEVPRAIAVTWEEIGLQGDQRVRDPWRQRDLGEFRERWEGPVPRHGVALLRLWPAR